MTDDCSPQGAPMSRLFTLGLSVTDSSTRNLHVQKGQSQCSCLFQERREYKPQASLRQRAPKPVKPPQSSPVLECSSQEALQGIYMPAETPQGATVFALSPAEALIPEGSSQGASNLDQTSMAKGRTHACVFLRESTWAWVFPTGRIYAWVFPSGSIFPSSNTLSCWLLTWSSHAQAIQCGNICTRFFHKKVPAAKVSSNPEKENTLAWQTLREITCARVFLTSSAHAWMFPSSIHAHRYPTKPVSSCSLPWQRNSVGSRGLQIPIY